MNETEVSLPPLQILVVDDELNIRKALGACLKADGHHVVLVGTESDAILATQSRAFDLAFVDLFLGDNNGLELIPRLRSAAPWTKVVVITAFASVDTAVESMKRGATDYLPKPFTPLQVSMVTRKMGQLRALEQRVAVLQDELGQSNPQVDLGTRSPAMQRALALSRQAAQSDATVLICGASGTGKTILARAMHSWSARAAKPFAMVACPALPADLLESELFGHVRGAFTGAVRDNPGRIAASEGGTLFLDEIGELPLRLQPKLLRFLQDRQYERIGDQVTHQADVRIIAATNADLHEAVTQGRFREDLWYRLNVICIDLPRLRDRSEDVRDLAERLLAYFARQNRKPGLRLNDQAAAALEGYHWPGNIRELRNVIERAAILCIGEQVGVEHLHLGRIVPDAAPKLGDPIALERMEELHIRGVLSTTPSIEKAAKILGMDSVTLWRRRKKYGI